MLLLQSFSLFIAVQLFKIMFNFTCEKAEKHWNRAL